MYKQYTLKILLLPSITWLEKSLSIVLAPTVRVHGSVLDTDPAIGPEFPAEATKGIPWATAWKEPMDILLSKKSGGLSEPKDMEITSTPSFMAASKAAKMSASKHP